MTTAMQVYFETCARAGMAPPQILGRASAAMQKAFS
jgi:hypothetical protein